MKQELPGIIKLYCDLKLISVGYIYVKCAMYSLKYDLF